MLRLAADSTKKNTPEAAALTEPKQKPLLKNIREMDPAWNWLKDPAYKNAPINIYSNLFNIGYKQYETKKCAESFETFKKVDEYSAILYQNRNY